MDIQVGGRAESLDEGNRAGVCCGALQVGPLEQKPRNALPVADTRTRSPTNTMSFCRNAHVGPASPAVAVTSPLMRHTVAKRVAGRLGPAASAAYAPRLGMSIVAAPPRINTPISVNGVGRPVRDSLLSFRQSKLTKYEPASRILYLIILGRRHRRRGAQLLR